MYRRLMLVFLVLLVACNSELPAPTTPPATPTVTLPAPPVRVTSVPDPKAAARTFLEAWQANDFAGMYALLDESSRQAKSEEDFIKFYKNILFEAALGGLDWELINATTSPEQAQVSYRVTLHSNMVGDINAETQMTLALEQGQWRVQWAPTLVLPQLSEGSYLKMDITAPPRANIYDRNGVPLVAQETATAIGLYPDYIDAEQEPGLLSLLAGLTGQNPANIAGRYRDRLPGEIGYLAVGEVPASQAARYSSLYNYSGVSLTDYSSRFYYDGGVGPHVVGYVSAIQAGAEEEEYRRKGYLISDSIGRSGLEAWGESYLAGQRGGSLYLFDAQGALAGELGSRPLGPSIPITTTLDHDLQLGVQAAIAGFRGAVVVIERDTGRVLAMASSPGFDPNAYQTANYNWSALIGDILADPSNPTFNRATQGQYPLGSVFKIITMAAGLESGRYTPETEYMCDYVFTELGPETPLYDWTWERFERNGVTQPSGLLTLSQGLMRSCNPYFYHIGLDLFNAGLTTTVSNMARGFGLGSKTGIVGVEELAGQVPDPGSKLDATNLAIGQGNLQVTPLQVARFVAAVGNGGKLLRPQIIERMGLPGEAPIIEFAPEVQGELPITPETLAALQTSMIGVIKSQRPEGTAYRAFNGLSVPVAGKTGTATSGQGLPHAWFAGYTYAENEDKPDIAIAVIAENVGDGSEFAAPIFRRVIEVYFSGKPLRLYRWESAFGVTRTPTPEVTETPTPEPEAEEATTEGG